MFRYDFRRPFFFENITTSLMTNQKKCDMITSSSKESKFQERRPYTMKTIIAAGFYYECEEQAIFQSEEYSFSQRAHIEISSNWTD